MLTISPPARHNRVTNHFHPGYTMMHASRLAVLILIILLAAHARGEDIYYHLPLTGLTITDGTLEGRAGHWQDNIGAIMWPHVILDGEGEAWVNATAQDRAASWGLQPAELSLFVRLPQSRQVTGRLYLGTPENDRMNEIRFTIPQRDGIVDGHEAFYRAKASHYDRLRQAGLPGSAWFRHQARAARTAGRIEQTLVDNREFNRRPDALLSTYDLFTGGRAISENLQLDRVMPILDGPPAATVDLASIDGITISEMDWQAKIGDAQPALDPLAAALPADQHVVFFQSIPAALGVLQMAEQYATPALQSIEPRSEVFGVRDIYERQIGLRVSDLAEIAKQHDITSLALTGSDPYIRVGTDIAVLLATDDADALHDALTARIAANRQDGLSSPGATSRSLLGKIAGAVIITNSPAQMQRLNAVRGGHAESLASLPEYTFFRHRYELGTEGESAFLMLTDATIRRWCGPKWRIADSRRTRAAAQLYDLQSQAAPAIVTGDAEFGPLDAVQRGIDLGEVRLAPDGIHSSLYGTTAFMTPIAELDLEKVTEPEAAAYQQWRDGYQRNWSGVFDPIGLRLALGEGEVAADLTVMPLIGNSDYRQMIAIVQGASIKPTAGDPHDNTLLHIAYAINVDSEPMQSLKMTLSQMAPGIGVNPLGWMGESIALYVDEDPIWQELAQAEDVEAFFTANFHRLPIAFHAEVSSGLKLTAFLGATRAILEQSAPGMTIWTPMEHSGQPYVRITPSDAARSDEEMLENLAIYYAASNQGLVITLHEALLHRAIDRQIERRQQKDEGAQPESAWLGESLAASIDAPATLLTSFNRDELRNHARRMAWSNIPILNEWKRLFPDRDPVEVHAGLFDTTLVCPGGGEYEWNDTAQTMQSTAYGHPADPRQGPSPDEILRQFKSSDFGVTFEDDGLRARAKVKVAE